MPEFTIKDKVVVVTGASSGIGSATAIAFARNGAKIALIGRNEASLNRVREKIRNAGGAAHAFPLDLSQLSRIPDCLHAIRSQLGTIDVLVNNAAYAVGGLAEDCPLGEYRKNLEVNFYAPLALIQQILPDLKQKRSGQVINVTSGVGRRALPGFSSYCVSKSALNSLTESLRLEVNPFGIDVILVSPGRVSSEFHHRIEFYGRWKMELPPMQMRSPEQIAALIQKASRKRMREITVWGPGLIGHHLNYWSPRLVDWLLAKKYPTN